MTYSFVWTTQFPKRIPGNFINANFSRSNPSMAKSCWRWIWTRWECSQLHKTSHSKRNPTILWSIQSIMPKRHIKIISSNKWYGTSDCLALIARATLSNISTFDLTMSPLFWFEAHSFCEMWWMCYHNDLITKEIRFYSIAHQIAFSNYILAETQKRQ